MSSTYTVLQTDWEEIPAATRKRMIVTGAAAVDVYLDSGRPVEHNYLLVYADLQQVPERTLTEGQVKLVLDAEGFEFPAGDTHTVFVILEAVPEAGTKEGMRVAVPRVALEDYRTGNPRMFTYRVQHDERFRAFAEQYVPEQVARHLEQAE